MPYLLPDDRLLAMLREDAPYGDLTTRSLGIGERLGTATFRTHATMTACCVEEAERLMLLAGCTAVRRMAATGAQIEAGGDLLIAEGHAAALHRGLDVAQSLMAVTSGIATRARRLLCAARQGRPGIAVACTGRHLPGAKDVMVKAIIAGGCIPHRLGLSDSVLVSARHRVFLGRQPPHLWVAALRAAQPERKIEVAADSVDEALWFAAAGVDAVQLNGLSPEQVAEAVRAMASLPSRPLLAVAGEVTEANAAAFASAGAELLVTSAAYAAAPAEIGVAVAAAP